MFDTLVSTGFAQVPLWGFALICAIVCGIGAFFGSRRSLLDCELTPGWMPVIYGVIGTLLGLTFAVMVLGLQSQHTPVVIPSEVNRMWRVVYHLSLIVLLLMITSTDLKSYYIVTWNCWLGILIGVVGAVAVGEFQLVHVWVDWNRELPQLSGPYLPEWLAPHPHLHGLAWSSAGILMGTCLAWMTRTISSKLLAKPTFGSGDVFLMAMIGAYLGWQPTLIAFLIAPVIALSFGVIANVRGDRPALPYGPFLALAAIIILFCWKWIWMFEVPLTVSPNPDRSQIFAVRRFFGDWQSMLLTAGLGLTLFVVLLSLLRYYKSLEFRRSSDDSA